MISYQAEVGDGGFLIVLFPLSQGLLVGTVLCADLEGSFHSSGLLFGCFFKMSGISQRLQHACEF